MVPDFKEFYSPLTKIGLFIAYSNRFFLLLDIWLFYSKGELICGEFKIYEKFY